MDFKPLYDFMDYMAMYRTPGCCAEVCIDGKSVFRYSCGYSDLESRTPMTGDEYFNIYSCSKIVTVTAGLQMLERGLFKLSDNLCDYIPQYEKMNIRQDDGEIIEAKKKIKISDLFCMSAGFDYNFECDAIKNLEKKTDCRYNASQFATAFASEPLHFEPGTHWKYSVCHDILAGLIEIVSGMSFGEYVSRNIFEPLGMNNTFYHRTKNIESKIASQYKFVADDADEKNLDIVTLQMKGSSSVGHFVNVGKKIDGPFCKSERFESGGAGITTTLDDYMKILSALSRHGVGANGERILSDVTVELMKQNRLDETQLCDFNWQQLRGYGYGLGVRTHIDKSKSKSLANIGEFGWGGAAGATAIMDTKERLSVFFLQHTLNPREEWYQPRLINAVYSCL